MSTAPESDLQLENRPMSRLGVQVTSKTCLSASFHCALFIMFANCFWPE